MSTQYEVNLEPPRYDVSAYAGGHLRMRFFKEDGDGGKVDLTSWTSEQAAWNTELGGDTPTTLTVAFDPNGTDLVVDIPPATLAGLNPTGWYAAGANNADGHFETLGWGTMELRAGVFTPT